MNQRLTEKLSKLSESLNAATKMDDVKNAIVEVERLVLKSNYEDRQSGGKTDDYEKRDYVVGEANTRGLSWKLNLFRTVADASFCKMVRVGIHGGNVMILGQGQNIDTALQVYNALVPVYEKLSAPAFTEFSDGREDGAPAVNRTGWINQWLVSAPAELGTALDESRAKDVASNSKIATMVAEAETALKEFQSTIIPPKVSAAPKTPKAPKSPKSGSSPRLAKGEKPTEGNGVVEASDSESEELEDTPDDDDAYPGDDAASQEDSEAGADS